VCLSKKGKLLIEILNESHVKYVGWAVKERDREMEKRTAGAVCQGDFFHCRGAKGCGGGGGERSDVCAMGCVLCSNKSPK